MPLQIMKEVKCLKGRLVALKKFIVNLGKSTLSFFWDVKKNNQLLTNKDCQKSFEMVKFYLFSFKILFQSKKGLKSVSLPKSGTFNGKFNSSNKKKGIH